MSKLFGVALLSSTVAVLGACGGERGAGSQVMARVNDAEITVSQLRVALKNRAPESVTQADLHQAVDGLIDEQILYDAALRQKLDRDPQVMQTLEVLRRQALARAYAERTLFPREEISAAQQVEYYKKHPALFQARRIYHMLVYGMPASRDAALESELIAAHSPQRIAEILRAHQLPAEAQTLTRAAEQLPLDDLPRFQAAAASDALIMAPAGGTRVLMYIAGIEDSPINLEQAQPLIERYLVNVRNEQAVAAFLKQSRSVVKIAYYDAPGTNQSREPEPETALTRELSQGKAVLN